MKTIEFDAKFVDYTSHVQLVANEYGGGGDQILIDNTNGQIIFVDGTWRPYLNSNTILIGDDITVVSQIIEKPR